MFWGKGDTSKLGDDEKLTLGHLRRLGETGHIVILEPEGSAVAIRAIEFFRQWESVLKLMNSIKNTAILVGAILAIYWVTKGEIVSWIAGIAGGTP